MTKILQKGYARKGFTYVKWKLNTKVARIMSDFFARNTTSFCSANGPYSNPKDIKPYTVINMSIFGDQKLVEAIFCPTPRDLRKSIASWCFQTSLLGYNSLCTYQRTQCASSTKSILLMLCTETSFAFILFSFEIITDYCDNRI